MMATRTVELVPEKSDGTCTRGNRWKSGDPVAGGWVASHDVLIYKASVTILDSYRKTY